ncbi:MAG: hypothetical protein ACFFEN_10955 [Candidatus Thorarchaeota archaeon]
MGLNWTPEAIIEILVVITIFTAGFLSYIDPKTRKIRSLLYIRLGIYFMGLFFLIDVLSILFLSTLLCRIYALMLFPSTVFFIIGINYVIKDSFNSVALILAFSLGILYCFVALQPNSVNLIIESGFLTTNMAGLFEIVGDCFQVLLGIVVFYWGLKTLLNVPFLIRREALIFFIGIIFASIVTLIIYIFYYLDPIYISFANIATGVGCFMFIIAIVREPKLLYILPYTVHRIIVKDREGFPLYDHDWAESKVNETLFSGFLNAVQLMSADVMNIGGLLDINLEEGILILKESELITVGLIASKSSVLLRDSIVNFTNDFEKKFEKELKRSVKDMTQYEGTIGLVEKHFSNFPYKIIKSKKQPLLLTGKFSKIPLELENKLRKVFPNEEEFNAIKNELIKSPLSVSSEFIKLYDDLKDELKKISEEEMKLLDEKLEKN